MISTRGRYALRLMVDIAKYSADKPVRIKEIAKRQGISDKYLEQIVAGLNKAGLVRSIRGPQGGYRLTKEVKDYTVGEILRVIEGSLAPVSCMDTDVIGCERREHCCTLPLWKKLNDAINDVVDHTTLENLLEWDQDGSDNYVI